MNRRLFFGLISGILVFPKRLLNAFDKPVPHWEFQSEEKSIGWGSTRITYQYAGEFNWIYSGSHFLMPAPDHVIPSKQFNASNGEVWWTTEKGTDVLHRLLCFKDEQWWQLTFKHSYLCNENPKREFPTDRQVPKIL